MKKAKQLISLILVTCMLLPTQVLAYLGRVNELLYNSVNATSGSFTASDGSHFRSLKTEDGMLMFCLAVDGPSMGKSVTMSERGYGDPAESISKGVYEQARFTIQTGKTQRALKIEEVTPLTQEDLEREGIGFIALPEQSLTVRYRFSGYSSSLSPTVDCYINYSIIRLGAGTTDGEITGEMDFSYDENPQDNRTYAVLAHGIWKTSNADKIVAKYVFRCTHCAEILSLKATTTALTTNLPIIRSLLPQPLPQYGWEITITSACA